MNYSVAVIMSVYKSDNPGFFLDSVRSMLNQTYPCDIYLYQDGPVSSELQRAITSLESNQRVYVYRSEINQGLASALNNLISIVFDKGYDFIARMDSDDLSLPSRVEKQVFFFLDNPTVDICGTSCSEFGATYALNEKHLPSTHDELVKFSALRCPFIHPSVMFRSRVFAKGARYPENTHFTEDMALWYILLEQGFNFGNLQEVLIRYRLNENTINRRKGFDKSMQEFKLRVEYMKKLRLYSFKNKVLVRFRIVFHILPGFCLKFLYKNFRG